MASVAAAATQGAITPDEAVALAQMVESFTRILDAVHVERKRYWRGRLWWAALTTRHRGDQNPFRRKARGLSHAISARLSSEQKPCRNR
jgi:hypothetical protein